VVELILRALQDGRVPLAADAGVVGERFYLYASKGKWQADLGNIGRILLDIVFGVC
jgi:hypothetical protein